MIGAILGDMIGSPYEFDQGEQTKDFPLFSAKSKYTDDTVMTLAVGKAFLLAKERKITDDAAVEALVSEQLRDFAGKYPYAGYGWMFQKWVLNPQMEAYGSYGNGSAMRVSAVAWLYDTLEDVLHAAQISAQVTHNHPEGIKGAQATASAILLARTGHSKAQIKKYIEDQFGYRLNRTLAEIRPGYHHVENCMETVPEAITAFLEGESTEDVIRNAVSLGGDTDTLGAIAGSIAEAFYGVPEELRQEALARLPEHLRGELAALERQIAAD